MYFKCFLLFYSDTGIIILAKISFDFFYCHLFLPSRTWPKTWYFGLTRLCTVFKSSKHPTCVFDIVKSPYPGKNKVQQCIPFQLFLNHNVFIFLFFFSRLKKYILSTKHKDKHVRVKWINAKYHRKRREEGLTSSLY